MLWWKDVTNGLLIIQVKCSTLVSWGFLNTFMDIFWLSFTKNQRGYCHEAVIDISFDSIKSFYELMISFEWREKKSLKQKLIRKNWQTLWKRNKTKESIDGNLLSKWSDDTRLLFTMCIHVYEINLFSQNCYSSWNF